MPRAKRDLPWLAKRNGVYYANFYQPPSIVDGVKRPGRTRAVSLHTGDANQASVAFASFLSQGQSIYAAGVETVGLTVAKLLDDYEREHVNHKVTDKVRQQNAIAHLKAYFGHSQVGDLDIPASRGYADSRRKGAVGGGRRHFGDRAKGSDSTIRRELNVLQAAINHARKWKRLNGADPRLELPAGAPPEETKWLTRDEVKALHEAAEGPLRDFVTLAYYTAARRAAIEQLRVEQVNLTTMRLNLRPVGQAVTKKRRALQAIHKSTIDVLKRLVNNAQDGWLFGKNVDFYRAFHEAALKAGIDEARAHPHILRHSRATHLLMDGRPPYAVAGLLGDTLTTVLRVYGHHCPDYGADALGDE